LFIYQPPLPVPLVLISLDGFRHDFLTAELTPHLFELQQRGVSPLHLSPMFPSVTFPNHYSIATGLYPESHGIVSNEFYDPITGAKFHYQNASVTEQSIWWGGEPIWVTAEKQGLRTAVCMYPGSNAVINVRKLYIYIYLCKGKRPTYLQDFDPSISSDDKSEMILAWLDLPLSNRPSFVAAYYQQVDMAGHRFGPESIELFNALKILDNAVGRLVNGLKDRDLVNLVIVSDHGMLQVERNATINYSEFIDFALVKLIDHRPLLSIYVKNNRDIDLVYERMKRASLRLETFDVYRYEELNLLHASNLKIGDIFAIPAKGYWFIDKEPQGWGFMPGLHGYDSSIVDEMNGIFIATGPSINSKASAAMIDSFANTEVYALMCAMLGLAPAPNNSTGTVRDKLATWLTVDL
jgi:predicted AlkP superfamily pyrophosphatase or phosphodiesterase